MTEYTPTTEDIEAAYWALVNPDYGNPHAQESAMQEAEEEFYRWLNEIRAEAWDEGHGESCEDVDYVCERIHPNPYRNSEK